MKVIIVVCCLVSCIALLGIALLYLAQNRLIYPAPNLTLPQNLPLGAQKIEFDSGYGLLLRGKRVDDEPGPLIIFSHGNGEAAFQWLPSFEKLQHAGVSVLLVEYPGYPGAIGKPSLVSIKKTMLAAFDYARELPEFDPARIIAYGRSIGGGAAALLAESRPVAALCLESTFSSLASLVLEKAYPSFLLKDRYDNMRIVRSLDIPIFLYHGKKDNLIPISHSRQLNEASSNVVFLSGDCGHNDCPRPWDEVLQFLAEIK